MLQQKTDSPRPDIDAGLSQCRITIAGVAGICDPSGVLFLPESRLLAVADLHLEKGAAFARRGMMLPPYDTIATLKRLAAAISRYDPAIVVCLGDNFHDRHGAALMDGAMRDVVAGLMRGREWIWITGNHDPDGAPGLGGSCREEFVYAGLTFRHEPRPHPAPGEIAGHLHPAATVRRREKSVRRACFACDGRRLLMPAFGVLTGGLDLRHPAIAGLFDPAELVAHLLGRDRIYSVRHSALRSS